MTFKTIIYLTEEDREILNKRQCNWCGKHLKRNKNEGLEFWINRKCCSLNCRNSYRKKYGLETYMDYKIRKTTCGVALLTIPKYYTRKKKLLKYYSIETKNGEIIFCLKPKKKDKKYKLQQRKGYSCITIPTKYIKKYNLFGEKYSFNEHNFSYERRGENE